MILDILRDNYANLFAFLNIVVLIFTLMVLIGYAKDTRRIADQTQEANLRPVVLRSGFLLSWQDIKPISPLDSMNAVGNQNLLEFTILKNIALDIKGYIVIDLKKYQLLFGNDISKIGELGIRFDPVWGWMKADTRVWAVFKSEGFEKTTLDNQIYISYRDIEGNSYYTIEDNIFRQSNFKSK